MTTEEFAEHQTRISVENAKSRRLMALAEVIHAADTAVGLCPGAVCHDVAALALRKINAILAPPKTKEADQ